MGSDRRSAGRSCLAIVLAAGEGTRMRSARPKVLHEVAGRTMLAHVLASLAASGADRVAVVVGPTHDAVVDEARRVLPAVEIFVQHERRGTAHAVLAARAAIAAGCDDLLVAFADTPLVRPETFTALRAGVAGGAAVVALGFRPTVLNGYGRFLTDAEGLLAIREEKDATPEERQIGLCNAGLMALDGRRALALLDAIGSANAQNEFYLTDAVAAARAAGDDAGFVTADEDEVMGVNDRLQLAVAEAAAQQRLRAAAMRDGATLIAPETVFLSWDTQIGRDVIIEPHVVLAPGVRIGDGARICAFSHLTDARVGPGASVGPFARLRPGAEIGPEAKIGNFVEIKASTIGAGSAVSHLTYIGDSRLGAKVNVGAGAITCNYDGFDKNLCIVGDGVFIGSNSALVAPVTIGAGAYVGTGSVITSDVAPDALALARGRQVDKPGWAKAFRAAHEGKPKKRV